MVRRAAKWHNRVMDKAKIAICGASRHEQAFFRSELPAPLAFYDANVKPGDVHPSTQVLSVFITTPVTAELIASLPHLKLITTRSTGTNHIDETAAKKHGVAIANVPAYGSPTVAEYTFTLLLMLTRRMPQVLHESVATIPDRFGERGIDLYGKTIGIIGTGSIGMSVARIAKGFGMHVLGYDLLQQPKEAQKIGFLYKNDVDELIAASDIITLHIPFTPKNTHFLNRALLRKLKHGAIIINTARGELIDTTALVVALKNGHVHAVALDVLESEYLLDPDELINLAAHNDAAKSTLRRAVALAALQHMPNVIITNHNAYNTHEALQRINQTTVDTIRNFYQSKRTS